jgi:hypothetical protein
MVNVSTMAVAEGMFGCVMWIDAALPEHERVAVSEEVAKNKWEFEENREALGADAGHFESRR